MPKWILVDIGNVLLLKDLGRSFIELLAEELGVTQELATAINKEHYTSMETQRLSEETFRKNLRKNLGYEAPHDIFSYFERAYDKQVRPNTKLFNYLAELRAKGIKTAVLSNTIAVYRNIQAKHGINVANGFEPILYSWEVGLRKPDEAIFEHALQKLNAKPDDVVFIDDSEGHLEGARKVGLNTIHFGSSNQTIYDLRATFARLDT